MDLKKEPIFVFDHETSVIRLSGLYQLVSVFVYGDRDFQIIDVDLCSKIEITTLPHADQAAIHLQIAEGLSGREQVRSISPSECGYSESQAEIDDLNEYRGVGR